MWTSCEIFGNSNKLTFIYLSPSSIPLSLPLSLSVPLPHPSPPSSPLHPLLPLPLLVQGPVKLEETFCLSALKLEHQLAQGNPELQDQIKKKLQAVQQKLQTDRTFAPSYKKAVEASVAKETKMYQQYTKAGRQKEAKVLMERVKTMQAELKKL